MPSSNDIINDVIFGGKGAGQRVTMASLLLVNNDVIITTSNFRHFFIKWGSGVGQIKVTNDDEGDRGGWSSLISTKKVMSFVKGKEVKKPKRS